MSEWERKKFLMWTVTLMLWVVTLAIAIYFACDYRRGKDEALKKMDQGIENSGKLVTIAERMEKEFIEFVAWAHNPFAPLLGRPRQQKTGSKR